MRILEVQVDLKKFPQIVSETEEVIMIAALRDIERAPVNQMKEVVELRYILLQVRRHEGKAAMPFFCLMHKVYRIEVLDCYVFDSLHEVRQMTEDWIHRCNHHRPNESLGRIPPVKYRVRQFPNLYF
jgi:putative transposase